MDVAVYSPSGPLQRRRDRLVQSNDGSPSGVSNVNSCLAGLFKVVREVS